MDDVWWTTPGPPKLTEAQTEAVHDLFQVILRELDGCTITDLIDVAGLVDR